MKHAGHSVRQLLHASLRSDAVRYGRTGQQENAKLKKLVAERHSLIDVMKEISRASPNVQFCFSDSAPAQR